MISSYVCRQCRAHIFRHPIPRRIVQWQPAATFTSLKTNKAVPENQNTASDKSARQEEGEKIGNDGVAGENVNSVPIQPRITKFRVGNEGLPRKGRYSQYVPKNDSDTPLETEYISNESAVRTGTRYFTNLGSSDEITSLGESETGNKIRRSTNRRPPSELPSENHPRKSILRPDTFPHGTQINNYVQAGELDKAWAQFMEGYPSKDCPALEHPSFKDIGFTTNTSVFDVLFQSMVTHFAKTLSSPASPTTILHKYEILSIQKPNNWTKAIQILTDSLLQSVAAEDGKAEPLLAELLSVWRLLLQTKGQVDLPLEVLDTTWQSIPKHENLKHITLNYSHSRDFGRRLQTFYPRSLGSTIYSFSAISIFLLLSGHTPYSSSFSDTLRAQNEPFIQLVTGLLPLATTQSTLIHAERSPDFQQIPEKFRKEWMEQITSSPSTASIIQRFYADNPDARASTPMDLSTHKVYLYLDRISRVTSDQNNLRKLERLLDECMKDYTVAGKASLPPKIYNSFMTSFMTLEAPAHAVKLWNHMIANGVKPDQKSWNAILKGCVNSRDEDGFNAMWSRMLRTGLAPDTKNWNTRISGLIRFGKVPQAFTALDEMGRNWHVFEQGSLGAQKSSSGRHNAAADRKNPHTKPSIEIINGAISALANMPRKMRFSDNRFENVQKLLQWAGNFSIKADSTTYNNLIKLYSDNSDYTMVFKLLQQMEGENLQPDNATYTMLIKASFDNDNFSNLSKPEQTEKVLAVFAELEAGGLRIGSHIYHSTIDSLLKRYNNFAAVRAVIDFMRTRNMSPSAMIYTSLFTHYFQQSPPDIESADALWNQIMTTPSAASDKVMFDRVIEGYASCGEVGKMMAVLTRMGTHGKLPGWVAMTAVIRALAAAGEFDRARTIVNQCKSRTGVASEGVAGLKAKEQYFFFVAEKLGLVGDERVEERVDSVVGSTVQQEGWEFLDAKKEESTQREEKERGWRGQDNGSMGGIPL
ncbi:hypothetical protein B0J11DRAFT_620325 [Dendryphion nanum]|uniref:Pentatricopeptide repeat-containing protein n=1 Tax=Dendryphion nanum TaxID=256645 RepID=A0A9P9CZ32_9PLEO|nr:hypothetical protein B0J11DRAFT_620325 [Dendryphion nanum]